MGNSTPKLKKYKLPLNRKLKEIINNVIIKDKKDKKINNLLYQNVGQKIKSSHFLSNYCQNKTVYKNISSLVNLIYEENTDNNLNAPRNFYESIFNYDIVEIKGKEYDKFKSRMKNYMKNIFDKQKENENHKENKNDINLETIESNNTKEKIINLNGNETIDFVNSKIISPINKENIFNDNGSLLNEKPKKKKHLKKPKRSPEFKLNIDLKDIEKAVNLEKIYSEKKKNKTPIKERIIQEKITKYLKKKIPSKEMNDGIFLELFDTLVQPNKLRKQRIHCEKIRIKKTNY